MILMRRTVAILLTVVFGFLLTAPVFASSDRSLPACCRRNGKHRCGASKRSSPASPTFSAPLSTCPFFPRATAVQGRIDFFGETAFAYHSPRSNSPVLRSLTGTNQYSGSADSHHKRGPPWFSA